MHQYGKAGDEYKKKRWSLFKEKDKTHFQFHYSYKSAQAFFEGGFYQSALKILKEGLS